MRQRDLKGKIRGRNLTDKFVRKKLLWYGGSSQPDLRKSSAGRRPARILPPQTAAEAKEATYPATSRRGRLGSTATPSRSIIQHLTAAMPNQFASPLQALAFVIHTPADNWEGLDGPDSGVGVDYSYRNRSTSKEA